MVKFTNIVNIFCRDCYFINITFEKVKPNSNFFFQVLFIYPDCTPTLITDFNLRSNKLDC